MLSLCSLATVGLAQTAGLASRIHDGKWSVALETTAGNCAPSANVTVTVQNARIVSIDGADVQPWGYVDASNGVVGRFSQGERVLRANGSVKGAHASGAWSASADFCGGRWTASRIN
jgi:hypothetical protein